MNGIYKWETGYYQDFITNGSECAAEQQHLKQTGSPNVTGFVIQMCPPDAKSASVCIALFLLAQFASSLR